MAQRYWQYVDPEAIDKRPDDTIDYYHFDEGFCVAPADFPAYLAKVEEEVIRWGYKGIEKFGYCPDEGAYLYLKK